MVTDLIANFLHLTDNLVIFGAGGTVEFCGPVHERPGQEDNTLDTERSSVQDVLNVESDDVEDVPGNPQSKSTVTAKPVSAGTAKIRAEETKRQTGDWHDWVYYGRAVGVSSLVIGLLLVAISIFTINFPSRLITAPRHQITIANILTLELWLKWTTASASISIGLFVGVYALSSFICLAGFIGMI